MEEIVLCSTLDEELATIKNCCESDVGFPLCVVNIIG